MTRRRHLWAVEALVRRFVFGTKTDGEKEQEEVERLNRRNPPKKPPRHDRRRNRMREDDPDLSTGGADKDDDLSLNYKKIAQNLTERFYRNALRQEREAKRKLRTRPKPKRRNNRSPKSPPQPPPAKEEHKSGDVWKSDKGNWVAKNPDGEARSFGNDQKERDLAENYAKGQSQSALSTNTDTSEHSSLGEDEFGSFSLEQKLKPYKAVRDHTRVEMEVEADEYFNDPDTLKAAPKAFKDKEDLIAQIEKAPLVTLSESELRKLANSDAADILNSYDREEKIQALARQHGKKWDKLEQGFQENAKMPPPIVLKDKTGQLYLLGGNTRLMAAVAFGHNMPVKVIDLDQKFRIPSSHRHQPSIPRDAQKFLRNLPDHISEAIEDVLDNHLEGRDFWEELQKKEREAKEGLTSPVTVQQMEEASRNPFRNVDLKDSDALAEALTKALVNERILFNPTMLGGQALSTTPLDTEALRERSEQAMRLYRKVSPKQREDLLEKAAEHLATLEKDDPSYQEMNAIIDGIHAAMELNDEQPGVRGPDGEPLREPMSDKQRLLFKEMVRQGQGRILFLQNPLDIYEHGGREVIRDALGRLDDGSLVEMSRNTPFEDLGKALTTGGLAPDVQEVLRSFLRDMAVGEMTTVQGVVSAVTRGKVKSAPGNPSEVYKQVAKEMRDAGKEDVKAAVDNFLSECMAEGGNAAECLAKNNEKAQRARFKGLADYLDKNKVEVDATEVPVALVRSIAKGGPLKMLDQKWFRKKSPQHRQAHFPSIRSRN